MEPGYARRGSRPGGSIHSTGTPPSASASLSTHGLASSSKAQSRVAGGRWSGLPSPATPINAASTPCFVFVQHHGNDLPRWFFCETFLQSSRQLAFIFAVMSGMYQWLRHASGRDLASSESSSLCAKVSALLCGSR